MDVRRYDFLDFVKLNFIYVKSMRIETVFFQMPIELKLNIRPRKRAANKVNWIYWLLWFLLLRPIKPSPLHVTSPATFCRSNKNNYMLQITFVSNIQQMIWPGQNDANGRKIRDFENERLRAISTQICFNPSRCVHNFTLAVHLQRDIFNFGTHDMNAYQTSSSMCKRASETNAPMQAFTLPSAMCDE